jgi:hypothetical protein
MRAPISGIRHAANETVSTLRQARIRSGAATPGIKQLPEGVTGAGKVHVVT